MPRDGSDFVLSLPSGLLGVALPADAPSLGRDPGVFGREFVTFAAVRSSELFRSASPPSKRKSFGIHSSLRRDYLGQRQSLGRSIKDRVGLEAGFLGQICGYVRDTVCHNFPRNALISLLFFAGRPLAIVRIVITIVVNTIEKHSWRSRRHIGLKEGIASPTLADLNPSSAIVFPLAKLRICATLSHINPDMIKWRHSFKRHWFASCYEIVLIDHSIECLDTAMGG